jgi:hypothetical protein
MERNRLREISCIVRGIEIFHLQGQSDQAIKPGEDAPFGRLLVDGAQGIGVPIIEMPESPGWVATTPRSVRLDFCSIGRRRVVNSRSVFQQIQDTGLLFLRPRALAASRRC